MAKKQKKQSAPALRQVNAKDIRNDALKEALEAVKAARTRENEVRMFTELQKAHFLVPVQFAGEAPNLQPSLSDDQYTGRQELFPGVYR